MGPTKPAELGPELGIHLKPHVPVHVVIDAETRIVPDCGFVAYVGVPVSCAGCVGVESVVEQVLCFFFRVRAPEDSRLGIGCGAVVVDGGGLAGGGGDVVGVEALGVEVVDGGGGAGGGDGGDGEPVAWGAGLAGPAVVAGEGRAWAFFWCAGGVCRGWVGGGCLRVGGCGRGSSLLLRRGRGGRRWW